MTLSDALTAPVRQFTDHDLDEARRVLGDAKLALRQTFALDRILDLLRPYNARLDEVNYEDMERQKTRR